MPPRAPLYSGGQTRPAGPAAWPGPTSAPVRRVGPAKTVPNYYCQGPGDLVDGRGTRHMNVGGQAIDAAVAEAFLAALAPAALQACLTAARQLEDGHDTALAQWHRQVEQARYNAARAERRYRAVDPDNRLVARGLETEWEQALREHADAEAELARPGAPPPPPPRPPAPKASPSRNGPRSSRSATTSAPSGTRRPPPTRTASSYCAPCPAKRSEERRVGEECRTRW